MTFVPDQNPASVQPLYGNAIGWLLDSAQSWFTGQVLGVDGGLGRVQART